MRVSTENATRNDCPAQAQPLGVSPRLCPGVAIRERLERRQGVNDATSHFDVLRAATLCPPSGERCGRCAKDPGRLAWRAVFNSVFHPGYYYAAILSVVRRLHLRFSGIAGAIVAA